MDGVRSEVILKLAIACINDPILADHPDRGLAGDAHYPERRLGRAGLHPNSKQVSRPLVLPRRNGDALGAEEPGHVRGNLCRAGGHRGRLGERRTVDHRRLSEIVDERTEAETLHDEASIERLDREKDDILKAVRSAGIRLQKKAKNDLDVVRNAIDLLWTRLPKRMWHWGDTFNRSNAGDSSGMPQKIRFPGKRDFHLLRHP